MYNILIVEDEIIQAQFLINSIAKEISEARIYGIASTGLDALNTIKEEIVDIILLDLKLPDISGKEIIDFVSKNNLEKYKNSIIIVTSDMNLLSEVIKSTYVFAYNSKIYGSTPIVKNIKQLIAEKNITTQEAILTRKINNELSKLNYNFTYIGVRYLSECIFECYYRTNKYDINLNKDIYPILAKKHQKSIASIKTNIALATSTMYFDIKESTLSNYLGYNVICKPKPKDIILRILENIS